MKMPYKICSVKCVKIQVNRGKGFFRFWIVPPAVRPGKRPAIQGGLSISFAERASGPKVARRSERSKGC